MKRKSIYKYASEVGIPVGMYLSLMSSCLLMSIRMPFLMSAIFFLAIGFPFYLGFFVRKIGKIEPAYMKFSSLWLGGIYSVIFGTFICMFFSGLYITFIEPGFVGAYCQNMIDTIEASPIADEYEATIGMMRNAMDSHMLPSGMDFVTTMGWFTCFVGSVLSLVIALIVSKMDRNVSNPVGMTE